LYVSVFAGTEVSDDVSEDASGDVSEDVSKDVSTVLEDEFLAPGNFVQIKKYNCRPHNYCAGNQWNLVVFKHIARQRPKYAPNAIAACKNTQLGSAVSIIIDV
jgi:hypothetical protein